MKPLLRVRRCVAQCAILSCALLAAARLAAQDVIVTPPAWFNESNATGQAPPSLKGRASADYPTEMRKADEWGYALFGQSVDAKGKRGFIFRGGSHPYFLHAAEASAGRMGMRPARKDGKPVDSLSWFAVIYNPASARPKGPDASARVLAVAPVFVESKLLKGVKPPEALVMWASVKLDESGSPQSVAMEDEDADAFLPAINVSMKQWRFAPARQAGAAVASEVRVPFMCLPAMRPNVAQKMTPPKAIKRVEPVYPLALRANQIRGEVTLEFVVSAEGRVEQAVVARSNNPAFEQPALEAIRKWTFEPGRVEGKPVNTKMQVPITFEMQMSQGRDAYSIEGKRTNSNLPESLRYDSPAKIRGVVVPIYPYELRRENVRGEASVGFVVDPSGKVARVEVLKATHPEFGLALTAAVEQFSFDPALKDGKPTISVLRFEQDFDAMTPADREGTRMLATEKKRPEKIFTAGSVDAPLKAISRRAPVFPIAQAGRSEGEALIELIVDEEGYVRLPRIISATAPDFGYSAVQAVSQWRFESPQVKGKAAAVRVRAPFTFALKTSLVETDGSQSAEAAGSSK